MTEDSRGIAAELNGLYERVLGMAALVEARLQAVMQAFISRDGERFADIVGSDARINALHIEFDELCFRLIALHQPVAVDLRMIVSVLK